ncbi:hypothetical protein QPK32_18405 [Massilia sp. YIM B02763]|uniref:hypothetical protein n=1 Tax=Massilia sp. YIM B02763 TaxID=3050130 RepID=UPI0025B672D4|nr:hypothetical protein [Massilia sp. YIM B02763]MDN4055047.1 hypothetical protein [Massilia sp. YIM B02763]
MDDEVLARPATILMTLRDAELARPGGCSMAQLRTLCDCHMSDLMRDLTVLAGGGWIALEHDAAGNGKICLSPAGRLLCGKMQGAAAAA